LAHGNVGLIKFEYLEVTANGPNGQSTAKITAYTQSFFPRNFWTIVIIVAAVVILGSAGGFWKLMLISLAN